MKMEVSEIKRERIKPVSEISKQFGLNTKVIMDARSLTYENMVGITGISKGSVHRMVTGESEIPLAAAKKISDYFNRTIDEMINTQVKV